MPSNHFSADRCTVIVNGGTTYIMSPSGEILSGLTHVMLEDNVNELAQVTVTLYCNVVGSELEANQKYKSAALNRLRDSLRNDELRTGNLAVGTRVKWEVPINPASVNNLAYTVHFGVIKSVHYNNDNIAQYYYITTEEREYNGRTIELHRSEVQPA